jgi:HSP20 family molecular chaperone IbpA
MPNVMEKVPVRTKEPAKDLEPLRQESLWGLNPFGANLPRLLEEFWGARSPFEPSRTLLPLLDISEDDTTYKVTTELPGLSKEDVKIQFEHGLLTISGEK